MEDFAPEHYKLLKRLKKRPLKKSQLTKKQIEDINYLGDLGCIRYESIFDDDDDLRPLDTLIFIKPKGKAIYGSYVRGRRRWYIPVIISILALAISILALYKSN